MTKTLTEHLGLVGLIATMSVIVAYFSDTSPMFDAGSYTLCIQNAVGRGAISNLDFQSFNCFQHLSVSISFLVGLLISPDWDSPHLFNFSCFLVFLIGVVYFYRLLALLIPKAENPERALWTSIFALSPSVFAYVFHFTPDWGLLIFLPPVLYYLLLERFIYSSLFALLLMLSKESGLLIYLAIVLSFFVVELLSRLFDPDNIPPAQTAILTRQRATTFSPLIVYILFLAYSYLANGTLYWWSRAFQHEFKRGSDSLLAKLLGRYTTANPRFTTFLADIFALNFNWVLSLTILALLSVRTFQALFQRVDSSRTLIFRKDHWFIILSFILIYPIVTFLTAASNLRYIFTLQPLLVLLAAISLNALTSHRPLKLLYLASTLLLFTASLFATVDPISKQIFGTFQFGDREMLHRRSLVTAPKKNYSPGRDSMVYNLEYLSLHYLINDAFEYIKPSVGTPLFAHAYADWYFPGRIDENFQRTTRRANSSLIRFKRAAAMLEFPSIHEDFFFLAMPLFYTKDFLAKNPVYSRFERLETRTFTHHGHSIEVYRLNSRKPETLPSTREPSHSLEVELPEPVTLEKRVRSSVAGLTLRSADGGKKNLSLSISCGQKRNCHVHLIQKKRHLGKAPVNQNTGFGIAEIRLRLVSKGNRVKAYFAEYPEETEWTYLSEYFLEAGQAYEIGIFTSNRSKVEAVDHYFDYFHVHGDSGDQLRSASMNMGAQAYPVEGWFLEGSKEAELKLVQNGWMAVKTPPIAKKPSKTREVRLYQVTDSQSFDVETRIIVDFRSKDL